MGPGFPLLVRAAWLRGRALDRVRVGRLRDTGVKEGIMSIRAGRTGTSPGRWVCLALAVAAVTGLAANAARGSVIAVPLSDPAKGGDSGWNVSYDDQAVDIVLDQVNLSGGYVAIEITKDFTVGPNPDTHLFPGIYIDFIQRLPDAQTVSTVRIVDESIRNLTGVAWQDFHWQAMDHSQAWFDPAASGTFGQRPVARVHGPAMGLAAE